MEQHSIVAPHREFELHDPCDCERSRRKQSADQFPDPYRVISPNSTRQKQQPQEEEESTHNFPHSSGATSLALSPSVGGLIPPHSSIARAVLMGNTISENDDGKPVESTKPTVERNSSHNNKNNNKGAPLAFIPNRQPQQSRMTHSYTYPQAQLQLRQQRPKSGLSALLDHEQELQQQQKKTQHSSRPTDDQDSPCTCHHSSEPASSSQKPQDEADSASGPPPLLPPAVLGHSAPTIITTLPLMKNRRIAPLPPGTPPLALMKCASATKRASLPSSTARHLRQHSCLEQATTSGSLHLGGGGGGGGSEHKVRRCISSKELGTLAPPSGSPYANMLHQREALENEMTDRLRSKRDSITLEPSPQNSPQEQEGKLAPIHNHRQRQTVVREGEESSTTSSQKSNSTNGGPRKAGTNESRNQRRAAHNRAVVEDLCEVVTDLFVAESKLINPTKYGVSRCLEREQVLKSVQKFVAALPTRYALGADTPSEVLLHMRLMAVARTDNSKSVVHIVNLDNDSYWTDNCSLDNRSRRQLRLVTICCADAVGLLEFITRLLGTGGSRVLDADVMLSSDGIALDRFVVEMNGRLRLDKVSQLIESFLKRAKEKEEHDRLHKDDCNCQDDGSHGTHSINGPLYYNPESNASRSSMGERDLEEEINKAVPLTEVLASPMKNQALLDPNFAQFKRHFSMPNELARHGMSPSHNQQHQLSTSHYQSYGHMPVNNNLYTPFLSGSYHDTQMKLPLEPRPLSHHETHLLEACPGQPEQPCPTHGVQSFSTLETHLSDPRPGHSEEDCPSHGVQVHTPPLCPAHGVPISPSCSHGRQPGGSSSCENACEEKHHTTSSDDAAAQSMRHRRPLVNRRAAPDLDRMSVEGESVDYLTVPPQYVSGNKVENRVVPLIPFEELMLIEAIGTGRVSTIYRAAWQNYIGVQMVALKVAMVNPETGDLSHVDELRREADIAARLKHPNVCDLVGVAADSECFCLAYDYCEGGSVLSLLSDTSRYYEYLPIALDVANGMAYLHSRDVIHRDLKPSNVLLTRDHRAKIADFGMSIANAGQELTAETGTYRYMAPEVIRHESYSSNADVYSFGVFLWQLITRQVPFADMTPVQAAYAVAEGRRPEIPESTPARLNEIIRACWDQDSHKRPSFTYIAMALADFVKMSFSPASVGAQTLQIANEMLATVEGNSNINVDFTAPVADPFNDNAIGLEI